MPVLDFKEIPDAHIADGAQDTFELFARDFFEFMGYRIASHPDRGADGGKDLIVVETRTGVGGETLVRWLVSCKHKATSGKSVALGDESNIRDRVDAHQCHGFIGFYSTLASSGLAGALSGLAQKIEHQIFDKERIEGQLLHSSAGVKVAERYFPKSISCWKTQHPKPAELFAETPSLRCKVCDRELLTQDNLGVISLWQELKGDDYSAPDSFKHVYWTCIGHCDYVLGRALRRQKLIDGWEDISDVMIPTIFLRWVLGIMNQIRSGATFSDEAFENMKHFVLNVYPHVSRHLTETERDRISLLMEVPSCVGGLGR